MQAISAIDNALWDALGKFFDVPLYKLLGGYRDRVPVIAIGGYYHVNDRHHNALQDEVRGYKSGGLAGIKMKVGRATLAEDIERVRAVREAGEVTLFSLATQIRHGPRHRRLNFVVQ